MAAKLEGEVSARAEAKASCAKSDTLVVKEEELQDSVKHAGKGSEGEVSERRGFPDVSLENLNKVLSMIERASSLQDDVLALSCLKEAQAQAKTLLTPEGSLWHS